MKRNILVRFSKKIASEKKPIVDLENWNLTKQGKKVCLLANGVPILDKNGELIGYRGVNKDITERKNIEKLIRESEVKNQAILNAIPDLIFHINKDGTFLNYKGEKDKIYVPPEEIIGKNVLNILPTEIAQQIIRYIEQALKTHEIQIFEYQLLIKDELHFFEARIVYCREHEVLAIVRDVSVSKLADKKLKEKVDELERFEKVTVNRELKMKGLKKENKDLKEKILELEVKYEK